MWSEITADSWIVPALYLVLHALHILTLSAILLRTKNNIDHEVLLAN